MAYILLDVSKDHSIDTVGVQIVDDSDTENLEYWTRIYLTIEDAIEAKQDIDSDANIPGDYKIFKLTRIR